MSIKYMPTRTSAGDCCTAGGASDRGVKVENAVATAARAKFSMARKW